MKKLVFGLGVAAVALAAVAALSSGAAQASSSNYNFTARGIVMAVDKTAKTVTVSVTHTSGAATTDLAGVSQEFNVNGAKFYKYDAKGRKVRTTLGNVPVGNEVVIKGAKRGDGRFNVSELTVNPNTFSVVGTVQDQNMGNKTLTVHVTNSTYKDSAVRGKDVIFYYGTNTTFRNVAGQEINSDEISADQERIKLTGTVTNGSKFEVLTAVDNYNKSK